MLRPWAFCAGGRSACARSWVEGVAEAVWSWVSLGPGPQIAAGPAGLRVVLCLHLEEPLPLRPSRSGAAPRPPYKLLSSWVFLLLSRRVTKESRGRTPPAP